MKNTIDMPVGVDIQGNLIAPDLTTEFLVGEIKGQAPEDFGLAKGDKLADEIATAWGDAKAYWAAFQRAVSRLPEDDPATTVTREQWVVPLLRSLGYDPIYVAKAEVVEGQTYAISHRAGLGSRESGVGSRKVNNPDSPLPTADSPLDTPPIHITGCRISLEQRPPSGTPRLSAHALVQEYLNRTEHLWSVVTNGLRWRLLRDSTLMTRLTYVEFDLEQILNGENFAEFGLFYRLFHRSRLPENIDDADECLLEFYHQESLQQGGRVRDRLRDGVEQALKILGTGFLQHPDSELLRQRLRIGSWESGVGNRESAVNSSGDENPIAHSPLPTPLTATDYYRQLLMLIYRLLFLMVAESRNLIIGSRELAVGSGADDPSPTPHSPLPTAQIYREYYSIERLRALVERPSWRREGFQDLWQGVRVTFQLFDENWRGQVLGLSPLDGDLFGSHTLVDLEGCGIDNHDLMLALRGLSLYEQKGQLRRVNYGALDVEELGSVYESLLEFHPQVVMRGSGELGVGSGGNSHPDSRLSTPDSPTTAYSNWEFQLVTGSDRKTTGSYYTPPELVGQLIKSALEPVIEERLKEAEKQFRELGIGSRESGVGSRGAKDGVVSGSSGLAGSNESSRDELSGDESIFQGGNVRDDLTDSQGSSIDSSKHRGRVRSRESGGIHPVSTDSSGFPEGTGNSSTSIGKSGVDDTPGVSDDSATVRNRQQNAAIAHSSYAGQKVRNGESGVESREIGNRELSPTSPSPDLPISRPISLQQLQESALLSLKVCDPACGSGHFLLAAARRIGKELARVRTGEMQPGAEPLRVAIRDVIQHCIYGVDLNPLAVDLCKVALWLEGLCRGLSLNFLDHRIKCGNSLVGVLDLDCLKEGIPDNAYKPVTGDDKAIASRIKKTNKKDLEDMQRGQLALELESTFEKDREEYAKAWREIELMKDDDPAAVRQKQKQYERSRHLVSWLRDRSACNLWTAAFFMPLTEQNLQLLPTSGVLDNLLKGNWATQAIVDAADQLAEEKRFFHWPLEFPEVFGGRQKGSRELGVGSSRKSDPDSPLPTPDSPSFGFDCVLGNPPWERIKLQEKEFFASRDYEIATAQNKAAREKLIKTLPERKPELAAEWQRAKHEAENQGVFIRESGRFLLTSRGDINTYAVFSELARNLISGQGRSGIIVQSGIATDDTCKFFFSDLVKCRNLISFFDFVNLEGIFEGIHRTHPHFCALTMSKKASSSDIYLAFYLTRPTHLNDLRRIFSLSPEDIQLINPNTSTCPIFRTEIDAELTKKIYQNVPVLENESTGKNPWGISFMRMLDMSNDSGLFRNETGEGLLPLYEAKMFHQFDHRWASYEAVGNGESAVGTVDIELAQKSDPNFTVNPRYWVSRTEVENRLAGKWDQQWLIAFRDITNATNERTAIFSLLPRVAVGHNAPLLFSDKSNLILHSLLLANLNSVVFDFVARQKVGGTHLTFFIIKQLPVLAPDRYNRADIDFIAPRVLELTYTAWDLQPFAQDMGYDGEPFIWNPERRALLRAELDAYYAHLYGLTRDELRYILDPADIYGPDFPSETFRVLKNNEMKQFGEYRTQRLVLAAWDRLGF